MQEQFIQDAISSHPRLQKVLQQQLNRDWFIGSNDLLNQEFNFKVQDAFSGQSYGARMDVIATFENRSRLAVVETKSTADPQDIEQLKWYLENCNLLRNQKDFEKVDFQQTVGILLANSFAPGDYQKPDNIYLLQLDLNDPANPFKKPKLKPTDASDPPISKVYKNSKLYTVDYHRKHLTESLHSIFDDFRGLNLPLGDPKRKWIVENPKSGHLAIHYKGKYIACFFVYSKKFEFVFGPDNKTFQKDAIDGNTTPLKISEIKSKLTELLKIIDQESEKNGLPVNFSWDVFDETDCGN